MLFDGMDMESSEGRERMQRMLERAQEIANKLKQDYYGNTERHEANGGAAFELFDNYFTKSGMSNNEIVMALLIGTCKMLALMGSCLRGEAGGSPEKEDYEAFQAAMQVLFSEGLVTQLKVALEFTEGQSAVQAVEALLFSGGKSEASNLE